MSETPPADQQTAPNGAPMMRIIHQYLKDLSFESPEAPDSLRQGLPQPEVEVSVDVNARRLGDDQYEVELACNATSSRDGKPVFVVESNYAGLFVIQNLNEEQLEGALLIEAPRLLLPFVRQIIANATRDGGFPPLLLEPLDFASMYRMQKERAAAAGSPPVGNA